MKRTALASLLAFSVAASAPVRATDRSATRGELALEMARAAGLRLPATAAQRAAMEKLKERGIDLGSDPSRPLTQADLARVGTRVGAAVSASRPDHPVTPGKARAFAQAILRPLKSSLAESARGGTDDVRVSCEGRDSRAGRKGTAASPADPNATEPPCEEEPLP